MGRRDTLSTITRGVWPPAILAGVASMPVTVAVQTLLSTYPVSAVMLVGTGVGYLYRNRSTVGIRVGTRMGLVGSIPLWLNAEVGRRLTARIGEGLTAGSVVETAEILLFVLLAIGLSTLMGFAGTVLGMQAALRGRSTDAA